MAVLSLGVLVGYHLRRSDEGGSTASGTNCGSLVWKRFGYWAGLVACMETSSWHAGDTSSALAKKSAEM